MLTKTKTATLILQKQAQKQQSNPESSKTIKPQTPKNKQLSIRHFGHYDAFSLTFRTQNPQQPKLQPSLSTKTLPPQYCLLEKQNYRLIEANFNILAKFATVIEKIRKELFRVLQFMEQYQYVIAVETVYALLDMLRNVEQKNLKDTQENVKYFDIEELKRKISRLSLEGEGQDPKERVNTSVVQQYAIKQSKPVERKQKKSFQIYNGLSSITHTPPQKQKDQTDYILQSLQTPYFTHQANQSSNLGNRPRNRGDSLENSGFHSRVQSAFDPGTKGYQGSLCGQAEERSQYEIQVVGEIREERNNRMYSEKNIMLIRGNHQKRPPLEQNKMEDLYRMLLTQATSVQYLLHQS